MFKESFKYYKSKNPPPLLDKVLDFSNIETITDKVQKVEVAEAEVPGNIFGLKPPDMWNAFELNDHPGLIFIRNPFTSIGQRYWTVRCLQDYSRKPNKCNLDALKLVPEEKDWWEMCQSGTNKLLIDKLRWVTLGYHHNWDTKIYSENSKSEFPEDLANITRFIVERLCFSNFNAEAAIVNYYHMDSTLNGHTDFSEQNLEAPLISMSFGQTAIFLIGGKTLEEQPTPMFLRSGDLVIMSKASRLCYHGVPKILQIDSRFWDCFDDNKDGHCVKDLKNVVNICKDEKLFSPFGDYLGHSRINLNVRQVLNRGQKRLCSESDEKT